MNPEIFMSSESIQRQHSIDVFSQGEEKAEKATKSEIDRLKGLIDIQINKHSSTSAVRKLAEESKRNKSYQLDLSADIVEVLTKIKSELR